MCEDRTQNYDPEIHEDYLMHDTPFPLPHHLELYTVFQKSDAKIQFTITTAYLIIIKYPLSGFNYHLSDVNVANLNKIHRTVSEQQLF